MLNDVSTRPQIAPSWPTNRANLRFVSDLRIAEEEDVVVLSTVEEVAAMNSRIRCKVASIYARIGCKDRRNRDFKVLSLNEEMTLLIGLDHGRCAIIKHG